MSYLWKRIWPILLIFTLTLAANSFAANQFAISDNFHQPIPAQGDGHSWMEPVQLQVGHHLQITDIDVYLDITHGDISDLSVWLDSPTGRSVLLKDTWDPLWRSPRLNMSQTVFDDEADLHLISGTPPYTGSFQPEPGWLLSIFDGDDAYGTWTLRIHDDILAHTGTLDGWELRITHTPEPASLCYLLLLLPLAHLLNRRRKLILS